MRCAVLAEHRVPRLFLEDQPEGPVVAHQSFRFGTVGDLGERIAVVAVRIEQAEQFAPRILGTGYFGDMDQADLVAQ